MTDRTVFATGSLPPVTWGNPRGRRGTVAQLLDSAGQRYGRKLAVITPERSLTYAELDLLSTQVAMGLFHASLKRGDRITLWLENGWRWVVAYYAILRLGAVVVPANAQLTASEVEFLLADSESRALIAGTSNLSRLHATGFLEKRPTICVSAGPKPEWAAISLDELLEGPQLSVGHWEPPEVGPDGLCSIHYTSGTTGLPKGAALRHESVVLSATMTALMQGKSAADTVVTALPCSHVYGCSVVNSSVACGMTLVLFPRLDERAVLEAIARYRGTILEGVPSMYLAMLNLTDLARFDLSSLRLCTVGGQGMSPKTMLEVEQKMGASLRELWGMTEIAGPGTTHPHNGPSNPGSIGIPVPFLDIQICDPNEVDRIICDDSAGELLVRGPQVMTGYVNDPGATAKELSPSGWLRTGDLVRRDPRGYLYLVDRIKEVILTGGYTVYPAEIERVLCQHAAVALAAVVPVGDNLRGQIPKAFIQLRPGYPCTPEALLAHCRQSLASYKVPREIEFREMLPTTATGKVLRRELSQTKPAQSDNPPIKLS